MKILIPMAGEGSRFAKAGYTFPKPLIDVRGKPMIQHVIENLDSGNVSSFIFLVRKEHLEKYQSIELLLNRLTRSRSCIVIVDKLTEGAACTALLARYLVNDPDPLLIANSDQIVDYSKENFRLLQSHTKADGIVFSFKSTHPKWSFSKLNHNDEVTVVAEKNPISDNATCGIYWYKHGKDFVRCADQMIRKNIRVNNEFYIAPVYNELILNGGLVLPFFVNKMHGLGTPEDLEEYLKL